MATPGDLPPPKPTGWPRRRRVLVALVALHWTAVLIFALPDWMGWRTTLLRLALPLPALNTHVGERSFGIRRQSVIQWYLITTAQYQRWTMFTYEHESISHLEIALTSPDQSVHRIRVMDAAPGNPLRRARWRAMDRALQGERGRSGHLAFALAPIAHALLAEPIASVSAHVLARPLGTPGQDEEVPWVDTELLRLERAAAP